MQPVKGSIAVDSSLSHAFFGAHDGYLYRIDPTARRILAQVHASVCVHVHMVRACVRACVYLCAYTHTHTCSISIRV